MATLAPALRDAPTTEIGTTLPNALPSWADYSRSGLGGGTPASFNDFEYVPELRWPRSVRETYPRMATDSQLKALERGTFLPITNYAWGIDANGAPPEMVAAACADFNLLRIEDAITAATSGESPVPIGRTRNRFSYHRHLAQTLKALRYGHYPFEQVGEIRDDGAKWGAPQEQFWHLSKLAPRPPRSLVDIRSENDGGLLWIRQITHAPDEPPIEVGRLVYYVWDPEEDPGDWLGTSMYRSCYREWLLKDRLLRIDVQNQESQGGKVVPTTPENATPAEKIAAARAAEAATTRGGTAAFSAGTELTVLRGNGGEAIASVNRHDEAMSRAWMLMLIQLASTAHGSRAVGDNFESLLDVFQQGVAGWHRDTFNEHVIEDWADWNYGPDTEYVPRLAFRRLAGSDPAAAMDDQDLEVAKTDPEVKAAFAEALSRVRSARHDIGRTQAAARYRARRDQEAREAAQAPVQDPLSPSLSEIEEAATDRGWSVREGREALGWSVEDLATRAGSTATTVRRAEDFSTAQTVAGATWMRLESALRRGKAAARATLNLPDRPLRREPTETEVRAAVDFAQVDQNWQTQVDRLVAEWKLIRSGQITELAAAIEAADSDLVALSAIAATPAGAAIIAGRLKTMAQLGAAEAVSEATRQGVTATSPALDDLEAELEARATAIEQLLTSSLSQAAANKAVQITGGALTPTAVAAQVSDYLNALTDTYLNDQFSGALSAAQNAGRLAAMHEAGPGTYYASELLDTNTCTPCEDVDGTEYATAEDAATDYPAGGYRDCAGGPRCRGTVVKVYDEEPSA